MQPWVAQGQGGRNRRGAFRFDDGKDKGWGGVSFGHGDDLQLIITALVVA